MCSGKHVVKRQTALMMVQASHFLDVDYPVCVDGLSVIQRYALPYYRFTNKTNPEVV